MKRCFLIALALTALGSSGCAICASPYDDSYSAYGGRWQRDVEQGRVASAFSEAGYQVAEDVLDEDNHDPMIDADENEMDDSVLETVGHESPVEESEMSESVLKTIGFESPIDESEEDVIGRASHPPSQVDLDVNEDESAPRRIILREPAF